MEALERIEKQVGQLVEGIDETQKKMAEQIETQGKAHEETRNELAELKAKYAESQKQLDKLSAARERSAPKIGHKSGEHAIGDALRNSNQFEQYRKGNSARARIDVDGVIMSKDRAALDRAEAYTKATMTQGDSLTGEVIAPDRVPGVVFDPERPIHVRQAIQTGATTSNSIRYVEESGLFDGSGFTNAAPTAEGELKPETDFDLEAKDAPVRLIAHTFRISKQMLDDIPFLQSHISARGLYGLMLEEDKQILYGVGTGENLSGLNQPADSQYEIVKLGDVTAPNLYDVIGDAALRARKSEYQVDAVMLNPDEVFTLRHSKDSQERYLELLSMLRSMYTVIETTAVDPDDFFVGAFGQAGIVQLFQRQGMTVELFEEDRDNVPRNLVTVRIEERIALPIYRPSGIQYGDFASAITAATT